MATLQELQAERERRQASSVPVAAPTMQQPAPTTAANTADLLSQLKQERLRRYAEKGATKAASFDPAMHYPGTTPEQAAKIPDGFVYDPSTKQYRDVGLEASLQGRGRLEAFNSGALQGVGLGFGDEAVGLIGNVEGRARGVEPAAMQNLRQEQARAQMRQDGENFGGTQLGGEIAGGVLLPGAAIKAGGGWLMNTARSAAVGMGIGGVNAAGRADGGMANRAAAVPVGAAIGAATGAAAVPIAKAASWAAQKFGRVAGQVFRQRQYFDGQTLTVEGRAALTAAGIDPDAISQSFAKDFARTAARSSEPVSAARTTQMAEFGIPAHRANATGNVTDFADFERARRGGMGQAAADRVGQAADQQMGAARRAGETIATDLSGGNPADQFDAAIAAQSGLRAARDTAKGAARTAYNALEEAGGGVRGSAAVNMGRTIGRELEMQNVRIAPERTNATAALQHLDDVFAGAENGSVPFMEIERARQRLVGLRSAANRGADGADQFAMGKVIETFDAKVDDIMTSAMIDGDDAALGLARNARRLWSEYSQTFTGDGAASRFIQKMTDDDASPDDVARWLFSAGKLGTGNFNSTLAGGLKTTLGEGSEAWASIRQGAFRQLIQKAEGTTQPGPQKMATNIAEFFNAPTTRQLSRELFSPEERAMMLRYSNALKQMVPPEGAVNNSGTAYELSRMGQQAAKALAGSIGFASGGPAGAITGAVASDAVAGVRNGAAVRGMINPTGGSRALQSVQTGAAVPPGFEAFDFTTGLFQGPQEQAPRP
jgi:hypothetical protein